MKPYLVFCNVPNSELAEALANTLVKEKLAACVNIIPGVKSIYEWDNEIEFAEEFTLLIKTSQEKYEKLEKRIKTTHRYEVPEIIAIPIKEGSLDYLNWMKKILA